MKYAELKKKQQDEVNAFPLGFAFGDKQFEEMMSKWGLDAKKNEDMITKSQVKSLVALAEAKGSDLGDICDYFGVGTLNEMTAEEYGNCLNMLNAKK